MCDRYSTVFTVLHVVLCDSINAERLTLSIPIFNVYYLLVHVEELAIYNQLMRVATFITCTPLLLYSRRLVQLLDDNFV